MPRWREKSRRPWPSRLIERWKGLLVVWAEDDVVVAVEDEDVDQGRDLVVAVVLEEASLDAQEDVVEDDVVVGQEGGLVVADRLDDVVDQVNDLVDQTDDLVVDVESVEDQDVAVRRQVAPYRPSKDLEGESQEEENLELEKAQWRWRSI